MTSPLQKWTIPGSRPLASITFGFPQIGLQLFSKVRVRVREVVTYCPMVPDLDSSTNRYTKTKTWHKSKDTKSQNQTQNQKLCSTTDSEEVSGKKPCLLGTRGVTWSLLVPSDTGVSSRFTDYGGVPQIYKLLEHPPVQILALRRYSFRSWSAQYYRLRIPTNTNYNNHRNKADRQTKTIRVLDLTSNWAWNGSRSNSVSGQRTKILD